MNNYRKLLLGLAAAVMLSIACGKVEACDQFGVSSFGFGVPVQSFAVSPHFGVSTFAVPVQTFAVNPFVVNQQTIVRQRVVNRRLPLRANVSVRTFAF